jgi:PTH2 family peptidyl-tRNA hydrolase
MSLLGDKAEGEMMAHENKMMQQVKAERKNAQDQLDAKRSSGTKQVIVMRSDLKNARGEKPRTGKLMAQAAHASMKVLTDMMHMSPDGMTLRAEDIQNGIFEWLGGRFTKVCCKVNSEQELLDLYEKAKAAGVPCSLIKDAGLTEFSEPTYTCMAVGPTWSVDVDEVTGHLSLF